MSVVHHDGGGVGRGWRTEVREEESVICFSIHPGSLLFLLLFLNCYGKQYNLI